MLPLEQFVRAIAIAIVPTIVVVFLAYMLAR